MKKPLITILILLTTIVVFAKKDGHSIQIKINGLSDTIVYFGHYYGKKTVVVDTVAINNKGYGIIHGDNKLKEGMYLIIMPSLDMTFFEIPITSDQFFSLETSTNDFVFSSKIKGSKENKLFDEFQKKMVKMQTRMSELKELTKLLDSKSDSLQFIKKEIIALNNKRANYENEILAKNQDCFLSIMLKASKEIELPDFLTSREFVFNDSLKKIMSYQYIKEHYFDNVEIQDNRLLRTPIYHNKLDNFIKKVILQHPDSVIKEGEKIVKLAENDKEMYHYTLNYLLNYYTEIKIMGMDKVFVHFAKNFFLAGKANWIDSSLNARIAEEVKYREQNLIGNIAPELDLYSPDNLKTSLHQTDANYTILLFYEPGCGHCKKAVPKFKKLYDKFKDEGVEVFAVYTQNDRKEWEKFIQKHSLDWINVYDPYYQSNFRIKYNVRTTPVKYLLNEKKEIIAKEISVEQIESILEISIAKN